MSPLPKIVFLLCNTVWVLSSEIKSTDVTFEELDRLNITWNETNVAPIYSCQERRMLHNNKLRLLTKNACHCDSSCSRLGTCCLDSPFQKWNRKTGLVSCITVQNKVKNSYFLIDKCPYTEKMNDAFQTLCEYEQNAEDDFLSWIPVTSLSSNLSYKNYFCFRCHEINGNYTLWKVNLTARVEFKNRRFEEVNLIYIKDRQKWFASDGENNRMHAVSVSIEIPEEVHDSPKSCHQRLISDCSVEWPQDEIREKCDMYMFVIWIETNDSYLLYKNPHCALCNFEVPKKYDCVLPFDSTFELKFSRKLYSFALLMDIVQTDGEKVGRVQRCDDAEVWDPFFKKCRKLICTLPRYTIKDGKCKPA